MEEIKDTNMKPCPRHSGHLSRKAKCIWCLISKSINEFDEKPVENEKKASAELMDAIIARKSPDSDLVIRVINMETRMKMLESYSRFQKDLLSIALQRVYVKEKERKKMERMMRDREMEIPETPFDDDDMEGLFDEANTSPLMTSPEPSDDEEGDIVAVATDDDEAMSNKSRSWDEKSSSDVVDDWASDVSKTYTDVGETLDHVTAEDPPHDECEVVNVAALDE
ncbi:hypothetical protein G7046_g7073 [Stylonectria norvegica]|nr:hypothetical protein G7046_g7073 [Stylonectria norvegica]